MRKWVWPYVRQRLIEGLAGEFLLEDSADVVPEQLGIRSRAQFRHSVLRVLLVSASAFAVLGLVLRLAVTCLTNQEAW